MLITEKGIFSSNIFSPLSLKKNGRSFVTSTLAKKRYSEDSTTQQEGKQPSVLPLRISKRSLAQSVVAVFGLGFIDAGYSGDWSRIGVISKGNEDLLKIAAFVVVPLCVFLVFSISKRVED
ncbi:hypothetical protein RJ639_035533 [Escallonia herrerae]|uniref:DUF7887 domain-containing protein n=1 Tax=Escallonia herrerae TaxID=1293975 RepID=A0AA88X4G5_9ASTE|nr:hypothetical protein RJ639_035533 [Escallonia herrerae]